ncbi:MAG: hypothetical protein LBU99_00685 [Spirochaetaceae bacterium]|nr:hypothetical protein [Spirochaetaceae bacterium]
MSDYVMEEGNLKFDFTRCGVPTKFDIESNSGLSAVDFIAHKKNCILFIEVKDYQNPNTSDSQRTETLVMLREAVKNKESTFCLKMGSKIKDSLLSVYAKGKSELFTKNVVYLLFINSDMLTAAERLSLFDNICGYVPTGLNHDRFTAFKKIRFKIVDAEKLKKYGITCTTIV